MCMEEGMKNQLPTQLKGEEIEMGELFWCRTFKIWEEEELESGTAAGNLASHGAQSSAANERLSPLSTTLFSPSPSPTSGLVSSSSIPLCYFLRCILSCCLLKSMSICNFHFLQPSISSHQLNSCQTLNPKPSEMLHKYSTVLIYPSVYEHFHSSRARSKSLRTCLSLQSTIYTISTQLVNIQRSTTRSFDVADPSPNCKRSRTRLLPPKRNHPTP